MERAVNDLIGTTVQQNQMLGLGGSAFEAQRNAIMREIVAGRNVNSNINSLNKLVKKAYTDFGLKGNMYSIKNGQLISKPVSTALTETDRFKQYFTQLYKDPRGKKVIKKKYGSLENLNKVLAGWCSKGKQKVKDGGRIGFAGDCSPEEKITNMKNAAEKLKQHKLYLMGRATTTPFASEAEAKALASKMAKSGGLLMRVGRIAMGYFLNIF